MNGVFISSNRLMTTKQKPIVLVTGGTGYIGQALIPALADDSSVGEIRLVTRDRRHLISTMGMSQNIRAYEGDIQDSTFLKRCTAGATIVYHLAAITPPIPLPQSMTTLSGSSTCTSEAIRSTYSSRMSISWTPPDPSSKRLSSSL